MPVAAFLAIALFVACFNLSGSGPLWPDAPQYANAGAMFYDWLHSGDYLHPLQFAKDNYARYPAFHMPYHPPAYPALLGVFFLIAGESSTSARVFIALCLWLAGCSFYGILKRVGIGPGIAFWSTLVFLTVPEIAYWSRSTMSEIPGLALILTATWFFLIWMEKDSPWAYVIAFALAQTAFLSRYLTVGLLPAWFLWALVAGKWRRFFTPIGVLMPALFLGISGAWTVFSRRYSAFEIASGAQGPLVGAFSPHVLVSQLSWLPQSLGWLLLAAGAIALIWAAIGRGSLFDRFWLLCWVVSCAGFVLATGIHGEARYFIYVLPVFPIAAAQLLNSRGTWWLSAALFAGILLTNLLQFSRFSQGAVGHPAIAESMAKWSEKGNVLVSVPLQSELIFEYRSRNPVVPRSFIRSDRTLALRPPEYGNVQPVVLAHDADDVLNIIRKGRIRYFAISQDGSQEVGLLFRTLHSDLRQFVHLGDFTLRNSFTPAQTSTVELWRNTGDLPDGRSELPVVVPTAGLSLTAAP